MKILGRVEYYNPERGYGFVIDVDESRRVKRFFHKTHIAAGTPVTGRLAQYEAGQTSRGLCALDIEIFGGADGPLIPDSIAGFNGGAK